MSADYIDIHRPMYTSHHYEVVAIPEDDFRFPVTITLLPVDAEEGNVEVVIPEGEEFDGDIFIFEFRAGEWHEVSSQEDLDMSFGLTG